MATTSVNRRPPIAAATGNRDAAAKATAAQTAPVLYLVATPIGNSEDISLRALRLLQQTPLIAAEDTRVARRLLAVLNIKNDGVRLLSLRAHNERKAADKLIGDIKRLNSAVYISDAGAPGVSDPGARLVQAARAGGIRVIPAPGASALTALLSVAAAPEGGVHFFGFPPRPRTKREEFFASLRLLSGCAVLFESPRRIAATLRELANTLGNDRRAVLGREMTKLHEQYEDATLGALAAAAANGNIPTRGEFALLVETGGEQATTLDGEKLFNELSAALPPRQAASIAAKLTGGAADTFYRAHLARHQHHRRKT